MEEISHYELVEEELTKLPSFFQQAMATVRVCAENEAVDQDVVCRVDVRWASPPGAPFPCG